jgi:hypothetical protein
MNNVFLEFDAGGMVCINTAQIQYVRSKEVTTPKDGGKKWFEHSIVFVGRSEPLVVTSENWFSTELEWFYGYWNKVAGQDEYSINSLLEEIKCLLPPIQTIVDNNDPVITIGL